MRIRGSRPPVFAPGALLAVLCTALLLLAGARAVPAAGTKAAASPDPIAERKKELSALKAQIDANRKEIDRLRSKERDLTRLQERMRQDADLTRRYLASLAEQNEALRSDLADRQVDLLDKETAASEAAAQLKRGVIGYYKLRHVAGPELLFSSRSFGELFARAQLLARMVQRERVELAALADERQVIAAAASTLEVRRTGIEQLQSEKQREEARLRKQSAAAQAQARQVRDERSERERRVQELEKSQEAIRRMIERLERERERSRERGEPSASGSIGAEKRSLPWPAQGRVIGEFGMEVNPRYGTQVPSNGIDIAAEEGTPILAVGAGVVEFVDWLPGYGRTVIVNHGGGFYTLYAHASTFAVKRGDKVAPGQILARVGDSDSIKGPCLHFELRQGERALNPREWLR
jgi:murein DD-endopeptidase MepM/ murein hydrolase activator NlpD